MRSPEARATTAEDGTPRGDVFFEELTSLVEEKKAPWLRESQGRLTGEGKERSLQARSGHDATLKKLSQ